MKNKKIAIMLLIVLTILTLAFIWLHSVMSTDDSQQESLSFLEIIRPFLEFFVGKGNVTDHLVRKLAHFSEFFALGVELCLLLILCDKLKSSYIIGSLLIGLLVALTDETIQIFSQRGSMIKDVWLDYAGFVCGVVVIICLHAVFRSIGNKKSLDIQEQNKS